MNDFVIFHFYYPSSSKFLFIDPITLKILNSAGFSSSATDIRAISRSLEGGVEYIYLGGEPNGVSKYYIAKELPSSFDQLDKISVASILTNEVTSYVLNDPSSVTQMDFNTSLSIGTITPNPAETVTNKTSDLTPTRKYGAALHNDDYVGTFGVDQKVELNFTWT